MEFFLEQYPDQAERLFDHIRRGTIQLNPIFNMILTSDVSVEELIRQLYPARAWARRYGLEIGYANHQETPTAAWILPTVLAGSGIGHLVKSILPYECPWAARLQEPPVFTWEGPDGSRIRVRWRNKDYVEGRFVLQDLRATNTALHDDILPRYEAQDYPYDAIALVGCYGDLAPNSRELPAKKAATIIAYNAQGWEYPKLVNASHKQFWDDLEAQIAERGPEPPVFRGDYGCAWDAWPASLAYHFAGWRRAQERSATADRLVALLSRLDGAWAEAQRGELAEGWRNLIYLADHAWNGANDENRALNAALRREWQVAANATFDRLIARGLLQLGRRVPTRPGEHVLVFNALGWARSGVAQVEASDIPDAADGLSAVDMASGQETSVQVRREAGQTWLQFEARDVPALGYRVYALRPAEGRRDGPWPVVAEGTTLESPFYRLEVSPHTGGIVSLYDKVRGRELVDAASPYHLNQCLYLSEGVEHTPCTATIEAGPCGPVSGRLIVRAALKNTQLTTTITVYAGLDRLDIRNELEKQPTSERQELDFAFPLAVPGRRYRVETPGVILEPGADQRPGAGQAITAVRHFVDVFNDEFGVTFSQADSGLVEFGHRTTLEDPREPDPSNSTLLAVALENCIDWHEAIRDQAGATHFTFRYSLRGHGAGFDPVEAVRFGAEDNNELLALRLPAEQPGDLPGPVHSFLSVSPDHAIITCVKPAEEDGLIVRLWECAGQEARAELRVAGLGRLTAAWATDLLEHDREALTVEGNRVTIPLAARGLATLRLLFE